MIKILLVFVFSVSLFASGQGSLSYKQIKQSAQPVSYWLLNGEPIPLVKQRLQTVQPVALKARELLIEDSDSGLFLIQNPSENKITYALYRSSGEPLSSFSLPLDPDLPLPKILIDSQRKRFISLNINGKLQARTFSGLLLWETILPESPVFTYENTFFLALNKTSGTISAAISQPQQEGNSRWETMLFVVSAEGRILRQKTFRRAKILRMNVYSEIGRSVILLIGEPGAGGKSPVRSLVLEQAQKVLWETDFLFRKALFADKNHLLLMGKKKARFIDFNSGAVLWELTENDGIFDSAVLNKRGDVTLLSGQPEYVDGILFYRKAQIYQTNCFDYKIRKTGLPGAEIIPGNIRQTITGELEIGGRKGLYRVPGTEGGK